MPLLWKCARWLERLLQGRFFDLQRLLDNGDKHIG